MSQVCLCAVVYACVCVGLCARVGRWVKTVKNVPEIKPDILDTNLV